MPGLKAGRYELHEELGRGAMGVVYKAFDPMIGRTVAVKTMRLAEEGSGMPRPELLTRFQTEARAAGQLVHPNIVIIYDAGEADGLQALLDPASDLRLGEPLEPGTERYLVLDPLGEDLVVGILEDQPDHRPDDRHILLRQWQTTNGDVPFASQNTVQVQH